MARQQSSFPGHSQGEPKLPGLCSREPSRQTGMYNRETVCCQMASATLNPPGGRQDTDTNPGPTAQPYPGSLGQDTTSSKTTQKSTSKQSSTHIAQFRLYLCCPQSVVTPRQLGPHLRGRGNAEAARWPQTSGDPGMRLPGASTKPSQPWKLLGHQRRTVSSTTHAWPSAPPQALGSTVPRGRQGGEHGCQAWVRVAHVLLALFCTTAGSAKACCRSRSISSST